MKRVLLFLFLLFIIVSCASKKDLTPDDYQKGISHLKIGNYNSAATIFEKLEDSQPFTADATNGLIMASYSYYKARQYEDSIRIINYFIQSNPINENLPYMYYLKGLNYYDRVNSMNKARDITESADFTFKELIYKYPNTEYAKDASERLKKTETYLSGNEMNIANYYLKRKNYIGAINHYINILNEFPKSNFVPEALYRLIEINSFLNLRFEAVKYYQILAENYKDSVWTKYSTRIIKKYEKS